MAKKKKSTTMRNARPAKESLYPCHTHELPKLKKISGQIEGIQKMIQEKRYCPEIITQIRSARAALVSIEASILETHLVECVSDAIKSNSPAVAKKKIREVIGLFKNAKGKGVGV